MVNRKSKSSKSMEKPEIDPIQVQDDLELNIQKVIHEDQIDIMEKLQPIFNSVRMEPNNGNTRDDVARKYDAFLKSIIQIMTVNNIISINVGNFIDPHSYNSPNYADLELTKHGLFANHCDGRIKVENVLDVLYDLEEPEQILRSLIYQIIKETNINKRWISELESCLESTEKAIVNLNIPSESGNLIACDKNDLNEYPK
jgi:hypothetical protein